MAIGNLMESEIKSMVDEVLEKKVDICKCEQCKNDIIALALNNIKPRYAGSDNGRVVVDSIDLSSTQTKMDIYRVVLKACEEVQSRPHHNR
ncbi:competence protein ComFB [Orenia metallireducens]|uniref:Competence protein ComFB n=1 Tax=Orenia metallireducens TaxID=1413210 RepID=A0A285GH43_9FIRM|nr:late competence development ComFB family protein [Orenia metallireducens]PRX30501.1 competence protein ComFB [Orenia metallireducens]SNY22902.1 competence protein ComFB [Orenia metallireducens]